VIDMTLGEIAAIVGGELSHADPHTVVTADLAELRVALEPSPDAIRIHPGPATSTYERT